MVPFVYFIFAKLTLLKTHVIKSSQQRKPKLYLHSLKWISREWEASRTISLLSLQVSSCSHKVEPWFPNVRVHKSHAECLVNTGTCLSSEVRFIRSEEEGLEKV